MNLSTNYSNGGAEYFMGSHGRTIPTFSGQITGTVNKLSSNLHDFHSKFEFHKDWKATAHNLEQRHGMMQEEVDEYKEALTKKDKIGMIDALVDLVYFALGTADLMDVDFDAHWDAVHGANMEKQRGTKSTRPGSNGLDMIKPPNWQPPESRHEEILKRKPFEFAS